MACSSPQQQLWSFFVPPQAGSSLEHRSSSLVCLSAHHCSLYPAITGTEGAACPASHLPPLPSKKATVQALLFCCLLLKAMFSFNHHSVISVVSLPGLHWTVLRSRAAIPCTGEQRQAGGRASAASRARGHHGDGPGLPGRSEDRHMETWLGIICHRASKGPDHCSAASWPAFSCSGRQTLDLPFAREKMGGAGKENWPHLRQRVL